MAKANSTPQLLSPSPAVLLGAGSGEATLRRWEKPTPTQRCRVCVIILEQPIL